MNALVFFARFEPLLHYALHVRDTLEGQNSPWAQVRTQMYSLAEQERNQSVPPFMAEHMNMCRLAVYALVDEILMDSPRQGQESAVEWYQERLQMRYLQTDRAGELFFLILQELVHDIVTRMHGGESFQHAGQEAHAEHFQIDVFQKNYEHTILYFLDHAQEAFTNQEAPSDMYMYHEVISSAEYMSLATFSLCILYGFKGLYYGPQHEVALEQVHRVAALLWQGLLPHTLKKRESSLIVQNIPQKNESQSSAVWVYFFIGVPLILSGLWYFICADLIERMVF